MSESSVYRPPLDGPDTNRIREFLKQYNEQHPLNADSDDEQTREQANQSPPPNCSICLGRVKSKCFTDSCMHQFCFNCLLEWSKIKPECPLCKQAFKSIIHNVTSMDKYDKYKVVSPQNRADWYAIQNDMNMLFASLPTSFSFTLRSFDQPVSNFMLRSGDTGPRRRLYQLFRHDSPQIQRFAQMYPGEVFPMRGNGIQWRNYVYLRKLYAEPLSDFSGHFRDISAGFYRSNAAQMHRLTPWLHRELVCVCVESVHPISTMTHSIQEAMKTYDITSDACQSLIRTLVPTNTDHFLHELINYARAPFDMVGYDKHVVYSPRFLNDNAGDDRVVSVPSESSDDSDIEWVGTIPQYRPVPDIRGNIYTISDDEPSASTSADQSVPSTSGASASATSGSKASTSGLSQTKSPQQSIYSSDSDGEEIRSFLRDGSGVSAEDRLRGRNVATPNRIESTTSPNGTAAEAIGPSVIVAPSTRTTSAINSQNLEQGQNIKTEHTNGDAEACEIDVEANDSESDDCLFVCARKPPHLRTPDYVECINSDSDTDVVFVSSEINPPSIATEITQKPSTSIVELTPKTRLKRKRPRREDRTNGTMQLRSIANDQWYIPNKRAKRPRKSNEAKKPAKKVPSPKKRSPRIGPGLNRVTIKLRRFTEQENANESSDSEKSDSTSSSSSSLLSSSDSSDKEPSHEEMSTPSNTRAKRTIAYLKDRIKKQNLNLLNKGNLTKRTEKSPTSTESSDDSDDVDVENDGSSNQSGDSDS